MDFTVLYVEGNDFWLSFRHGYQQRLIAHTRHRSSTNFLVHLIAGLIAYAKQPKKPSLIFFTPLWPPIA